MVKARARGLGRARVLIGACACDPTGGSEAAVGWTLVNAASVHHDVHVLTRSEYRDRIRSVVDSQANSAPVFHYVDLPPAIERLTARPYLRYLHHVLWHIRARRYSQELHRRHHFDVTHHVTLATDWFPSSVQLPGVPHIWGPVGGRSRFRPRLLRWYGRRGSVDEVVRTVGCALLRWIIGDRVARRSTLLLAQNDEVAERFKRRVATEVWPNARVHVKPATGPMPLVDDRRALAVGRLIPLKGLRIALEMLADSRLHDWRLTILGDGPERSALEAYAKSLGLMDRVEFLGRVPSPDVERYMRTSAVLLHLSLRDAAPRAVAEARSVGLPVLALNLGGPAVLIDEHGGQLLDPDRNLVEQGVRAMMDMPPRSSSLKATTLGLEDELMSIYSTALSGERA